MGDRRPSSELCCEAVMNIHTAGMRPFLLLLNHGADWCLPVGEAMSSLLPTPAARFLERPGVGAELRPPVGGEVSVPRPCGGSDATRGWSGETRGGGDDGDSEGDSSDDEMTVVIVVIMKGERVTIVTTVTMAVMTLTLKVVIVRSW